MQMLLNVSNDRVTVHTSVVKCLKRSSYRAHVVKCLKRSSYRAYVVKCLKRSSLSYRAYIVLGFCMTITKHLQIHDKFNWLLEGDDEARGWFFDGDNEINEILTNTRSV